jgi:uncharacterized protein
MDLPLLDLTIFLAATFAGAVVSGVAGFAFGLVVIGVWLHIIPPLVVALLISGFGIILQSTGIWKMRHAIDWKLLWPFLISGAIGVPLGVAILGVANPAAVRLGIGILLVLYSSYSLLRPQITPLTGKHAAIDLGVGFLNGVLGGMTGLTGVIITIWCGWRGWPKDTQRAVFQPVIMAMFIWTAIWLGGSAAMPRQAIWLFLTGLPVLVAGFWIGWSLYGRLDEAGFRRIVLFVLLLSGIVLTAQSLLRA